LNWPGAVDVAGDPLAGLAMLVESAGVPFPGEVFLLAAAAWAASRHLPIALVMLIGYMAATAGSDVGYILGRRGGRPFVERFGSAFHIRPGQLALAELVFARHGDKALLVAHFVFGLRTWASMLAGMANMPFLRFQVFSAAGSLVWVTAIVLAGYALGSNLGLIGAIMGAIGIGGVVFIAVVVSVLVVAQERATRRR
jgi:membrane protein DedA with SNARE-associated domain